MKYIFIQILKTILFYILGFMLLYPLSLIGLLPGINSLFLYLMQAIIMGIIGFMVGHLSNKRQIFLNSTSKKNGVLSHKNSLIIQVSTVCILLAFTIFKEINQIFFINRNAFKLFQFICFGNENLARILYTGPVLNIPYFILISISWISYNLGSKSQHL